MEEKIQEAECCPKFDPKPWEEKTLVWKNKKFVKDKVFCIFYIPLNFGQVMTKLAKKVDGVEMCLSDQTSMWNMDIYIEVDKKVEGLENVTLSGKFMTKVYEGEFKDMGKWMEDFKKRIGDKMEKMYMWYTTCPKCAKKWGKNYVVAVGKVKE
jgi:hypothetical protein